jgi:hypothetical protein
VTPVESSTPEPTEFDFLVGSWRVHHRRLKERLASSAEWEEFDGTCSSERIQGGAGNIDENVLWGPESLYRATTVRLFDQKTHSWSIWWFDGRTPRQTDPPLVGRFDDEIGTFLSEDTFKGQPIRVRFRWTQTNSPAPHWEQAFSADGGSTWETNWTMDFLRIRRPHCSVVELRQYTLKPGRRDDLVVLFDREFVESQEALGAVVLGQFRDLDRPDRFVWLRGFPDMEIRREQLTSFYGGPVWKAHRMAANDTMEDSDNVLLLRPSRETSGFGIGDAPRPTHCPTGDASPLLVATICYLAKTATSGFLRFFEHEVAPVLMETGAPVLAYFETESSPNTVPMLPIREGENVFVWFSRFDRLEGLEHHRTAFKSSERGPALLEEMGKWVDRPNEVLRLEPTPRSLLR